MKKRKRISDPSFKTSKSVQLNPPYASEPEPKSEPEHEPVFELVSEPEYMPESDAEDVTVQLRQSISRTTKGKKRQWFTPDTQLRDLTSHIKYMKGKEKKKNQIHCDNCGCDFEKHIYLKHQTKTSIFSKTVDKKFKCNICPDLHQHGLFASKQSLGNHRRKKHGESSTFVNFPTTYPVPSPISVVPNEGKLKANIASTCTPDVVISLDKICVDLLDGQLVAELGAQTIPLEFKTDEVRKIVEESIAKFLASPDEMEMDNCNSSSHQISESCGPAAPASTHQEMSVVDHRPAIIVPDTSQTQNNVTRLTKNSLTIPSQHGISVVGLANQLPPEHSRSSRPHIGIASGTQNMTPGAGACTSATTTSQEEFTTGCGPIPAVTATKQQATVTGQRPHVVVSSLTQNNGQIITSTTHHYQHNSVAVSRPRQLKATAGTIMAARVQMPAAVLGLANQLPPEHSSSSRPHNGIASGTQNNVQSVNNIPAHVPQERIAVAGFANKIHLDRNSSQKNVHSMRNNAFVPALQPQNKIIRIVRNSTASGPNANLVLLSPTIATGNRIVSGATRLQTGIVSSGTFQNQSTVPHVSTDCPKSDVLSDFADCKDTEIGEVKEEVEMKEEVEIKEENDPLNQTEEKSDEDMSQDENNESVDNGFEEMTIKEEMIV